MGVNTFTIVDQTCAIAPARLFKAVVLDNHNVLPKVVPQAIKSVEFVEGDSTVVGCVKQMNMADGKYMKSKLIELDESNFSFKYTTFEGDYIVGEQVESVIYEGKVTASGEGSHYKFVGHCNTKGDAAIPEESVKPRIQGALKAFEATVEYLQSNPQVYA